MRQVWLRTNRRALGLGLLLPALLILAGGSILLLPLAGTTLIVARTAAGLLIVCSLLAALALLYGFMTPRLVYEDGYLLVYLRAGAPLGVPIDCVECFFLGRTASMLPAGRIVGESSPTQVSAVVVRLAERAAAYHACDVHPSFGQWRDGYITIRGTWCEPLTAEVMRNLNHQLREAHRAAERSTESTGGGREE